mmetsp:Transcript_10916/g.36860  ORF Transcript_10916/g.36860 Transcript_10916/m.36860 type:complete len:300 (-) Transcript_10916:383-1282(-)
MRYLKNSGGNNMKNRNEKNRTEEEEVMENGWEEEDDKNEKLPIKGLPASFPAVRPSLLFHLALLLNGLAVGLLPALFLAIVPVPHGWEEQGVFWKDSFFLVIVSLLGLGISIILTLIRVPVKYQLTRTRLHIVSWARSKWWWSPCYHMCTPSYSILISDIISADVKRADCLSPPLCLPPPRTNFRSRQFCCVLYRRSMLCRLLTWTRTLYLSPEVREGGESRTSSHLSSSFRTPATWRSSSRKSFRSTAKELFSLAAFLLPPPLRSSNHSQLLLMLEKPSTCLPTASLPPPSLHLTPRP